jgi:hypothetical protein
MSLPTLEQYRRGATTWRGEHKGVAYTLSHHGVSTYQTQGTWCFYIHLREEQFVAPEDFARFDRKPEVRESFGSFRENYPYEDVPDYGFHGGITWYSRDFYVGKNGQRYKALKIGCDYGHLWDEEGGHWQGHDDVERDARQLIEKLVADITLKERCGYCGKYGLPDEFYTARNGRRVHRSQVGQFSDERWASWLPAEPTLSTSEGEG